MSEPAAPSSTPAPASAAPESISGVSDLAWTRNRRLLALCGLFALYFFFACYELKKIPLSDPDEPRYAAAGRTMYQGGSLVIPEFNGKPRINKPPLFYWLVACSDKICGYADEVSARLPSIFMGFLMLLMMVWAGARLYGDKTGFMAGLILCTALLFMALSRTCVIDQTFSTILGFALCCSLLTFSGRWPWKLDPLWPVAIISGIAFMTKGPAALIGFIAPLLFWVLFRRRNAPKGYFAGRLPLMLLAFAIWFALASWWFIALGLTFGWDEFYRLYKFEVLGRLAGLVHQEPIYYYFLVYPLLFLPWSLGLMASIREACSKPAKPDETNGPRSLLSIRNADLFLVIWLATVVLFFSVPKAKLATYMLPSFPAAALLTARWALRTQASERSAFFTKLTLTLALLLAFLLVTYGFAVRKDLPLETNKPDHATLLTFGIPAALAALGSAIYAAHGLYEWFLRPREERKWWNLALGLGMPLLALSVLAYLGHAQFAMGVSSYVRDTLAQVSVPTEVLGLGLALCCCGPWIVAALSKNRARALLLYVPLLACAAYVGVPLAAGFMEGRASRSLVAEIKPYTERAEKLYLAGTDAESLVYYVGKPLEKIPNPEGNETRPGLIAAALESAPPGKVVILMHRNFFRIHLDGKLPANAHLLPQTKERYLYAVINEPGENVLPEATPQTEHTPPVDTPEEPHGDD